jgi:hypothetical protein
MLLAKEKNLVVKIKLQFLHVSIYLMIGFHVVDSMVNLQQNAHQLREETSQHPNALDNEILQPSTNQSPTQQLTCRLEIGMPCGIEESTNLTMEILSKLHIFVGAGWGLSPGSERHLVQDYKKFTNLTIRLEFLIHCYG